MQKFIIGGFLLHVLAWVASRFILTALGMKSLLVGKNGANSIGGEKWNELSLLITVERRKFSGDLDDESDVSFIELVLADKRWGGLEPYGYRGTPGVVLSASKQVLAKLEIAPTLKLTEHGSLKLTVPLKNTREALKRLAECFKRTR